MFKTIGAVALGVLVVGNELIAQSLPWSSAGPVYLSGRCRNMIVDKANPSGNTLYLGSSTSGIFKSTDAGLNWANIENSITGPVELIKNISYLGQLQNNDLIIATGEGFLRTSQKIKAIPGTGIYKLSGNTLTSIANATVTGTEINKIACSPLNSNVFALATNKGILVTTDGGATFTQPAAITVTDNINYGLDVKFDGAGILYCSVGNEKTSTPNVDSKVYKSNDVSLTSFTDITPTSPFVLGTNYGRIELAVAPTNNNVVYASVSRKYTNAQNPATANLMGLFVSYNGGSTWAHVFSGSTQLDPLTNGGGTSASGDFAHTLVVDPLNSDKIYLGSYQMYSYTKTGMSGSNPVGTWSKIGNHQALNTGLYLHENIHDFKAIVSGGSIARYYFITDAGTYRSSDNLISIQPFYKGMATGQFNSVSISPFPKFTSTNGSANGAVYTPFIKYIGGTGGSGLNYFDGQNGTTVSKEFNSLGGEVFNAEYSKILPEAAYFTTADGRMYLNSDIVNNAPELRQHLRRTNDQNVVDFANSNYAVTGTPFRLWENYGQLPAPNRPSPDSVIFYNDSVRGLASLVGVSNLTTTTSFTLSISRPSGVSMLDSIAIRTGTAVLPVSGNPNSPALASANRRTIWIKLPNTYTSSSTGTTSISNLTVSGSAASVTGHSVILDGGTSVDQIIVNFATAPFIGVPTNSVSGVPDPSAYYKVYGTAYYKIAPNTQIQVVDKSISTKDFTYTANTPSTGLNWKFGSSQTSTMIAASLPTNVIASGLSYSAASTEHVLGPQSTATFFPSHPTAVTYTIRTYGSSYSVTANTYSNYIATTPTVAGTPTYVLQPGNVSQSSNVFTIAATQTAAVVYTVTANGTTTVITNYTVNPVTYSINTSTVTQTSNVFTLSANGNYTITAFSGASAFTPTANILTTVSLPVVTTATVGNNNAKIAPNNKPIKISTIRSARLAYPYTSGAANGIYVCLSPLSLNDPLAHICVSRDGALTTNSVGVPISSTINIDGNITFLEWANSGTELYFATDANKLYRVSRLHALADSSARFYNGKFHTGILNHNATTTNSNSPVRTTLLRTFAKPITSIAIGGRDSIMAVTFDGTGAAGDTLVAISIGDIRTQSGTALSFKKADAAGMPLTPGATIKTYCSLFEKSDPNKLFVGATDGVYYTNNALTSNTWLNQSGTSATSFPKIQVFDLKQQTKGNFQSYNSGQIFAATNGRGVWYNSDFLVKLVVAVPEELPAEKESNIKVYPNPTSSSAIVAFNSLEGESAILNIMDLTGKVVKTQSLGKLYNGETNVEINTDGMTGGVYLINVSSSSGTKRVTKLVVAK